MKLAILTRSVIGGTFQVDKKTPSSGVDHHATLGIAQLILHIVEMLASRTDTLIAEEKI